MKVPTKIGICFLSTVVFLIAGCSQFGLSTGRVVAVGGEEVVVSIKKMDYHFERVGHFSDTYMVFGGGDSSRAVSQILISGIGLKKAKAIHKKYPDFYRCKSPGAAVAQRALIELRIISEDSKVLQSLKDALSQHERNLANNGDRIFVRLEGDVLKLSSAILGGVEGGDVMDQLPSPMKQNYYLVNSAEVIEAKIQLSRSSDGLRYESLVARLSGS